MENRIKRFFYDDSNLRLRVIPHKKKDKIEALKEVSAQFEENQFYSEREVNQVLETIYDDFPLLRRNLIDFNFLCRDRNGYVYWKNNYYGKFCTPTEEEIYKFIIYNFAENTKITFNYGNRNKLLNYDLNFYLKSKLIILDKTTIYLNKNKFKFSDFNFYTSISEEEFIMKNTKTENTVRIKLPVDSLKKISNLEDPIFLHLLNLGFIVLKDGNEYKEYVNTSLSWYPKNKIASIMIALTTRCNFLCSYCYENDVNRNADMTKKELHYHFSQIRKFIDEDHLNGINFTLYGGEPSLSSQILMEELISEINSIQIKKSIDIISNGYIISPGLEKLMSELKVGSYQITLDGPKDVHDKIRKLKGGTGGTFENIARNMKMVLSNGLCEEVIIRINCSRLNIDEIPNLLIDLRQRLGSQLEHIFISFGLLSYGLSSDSNIEVENSKVQDDDVKKYCKLYKIARDLGFNVASKYCDSNLCINKELGCIIIGPNYNYYKCMKAFGYEELSCSFDEIKKSNLNLEELKKCESKKCEFLPYCFLGCLMDDYTVHGTMNSMCKYEEIKKINEGIVYELYK